MHRNSVGNSDSFGDLKMLSLNVSGLKRRLNYPEFLEQMKHYDVIILLETKLDTTDIVDIDGYTFVETQIAKL